MRVLLSSIVMLVVACELKPAPRQQPAEPTRPVRADAAVTPQDPFADAGPQRPPADAMIEVSQPCLEVGVKIAQVLIGAATDDSQRAALEQDRTKLVRRTAEACTRDGWTAATRTCFLQSSTVPELEVCGKDLQAP